jgi:hypothetical protein
MNCDGGFLHSFGVRRCLSAEVRGEFPLPRRRRLQSGRLAVAGGNSRRSTSFRGGKGSRGQIEVRARLCAGGRWIRTIGSPHYDGLVRRWGRGCRAFGFGNLYSQPGPASPRSHQHCTARRFEAPHLAARCGGQCSKASRNDQSAAGVPRRFVVVISHCRMGGAENDRPPSSAIVGCDPTMLQPATRAHQRIAPRK